MSKASEVLDNLKPVEEGSASDAIEAKKSGFQFFKKNDETKYPEFVKRFGNSMLIRSGARHELLVDGFPINKAVTLAADADIGSGKYLIGEISFTGKVHSALVTIK